MTTAPKLIREQLLALADDWDKAADKYKAEASDKTWAVWLRGESSARAAELRACANSLRSLAAEPVGGGLLCDCPPGQCLGGNVNPCRYSQYAQITKPDSAEGEWKVGDRVLWQSSNGNEFPATITAVNPPDYDAKLDDGTQANGYARRRFKKLRATDEGKGDEYAAEDTVAMDRIFGEQPKAEGDDLAISLAQIAGAKFTLRGEQLPTDVIGVLRMAADALSAAPQPEQTCPRCEYSPERCECAQPEQPARDGVDDPPLPWRTINELPQTDDLFWFMRGDTVDGPRAPQARGYDADEWDWFAPCTWPSTSTKQPPQQADGGAVAPDGYHYVYYYPFNGEEVIVTDSTGGEWNGQKPIRSMPYYYHPPKSPGVGVDDAMLDRATTAYVNAWTAHEQQQSVLIDWSDEQIVAARVGVRAALLAALGGEK